MVENENLPQINEEVSSMLSAKVKETTEVKSVIDLAATQAALADKETIEKVVAEKSEELRNDAEAKKIKAETDRINEEVQKVKAQAEKELAEINKQIEAKRLEVEELKAESDRENAFFERNKEILKYVNIKSKKTLGVMKALLVPAIIVFVVLQILMSPITIVGLVLENLIDIVGTVCSTLTSKGLKIVLAIFVILVVVAILVLAYYFGINFLQNLQNT